MPGRGETPAPPPAIGVVPTMMGGARVPALAGHGLVRDAPPTVVGPGDTSRAVDPAARPLAACDAAMTRYAAGEEAAFAIVYDELSPRIYGYLVRQTRDSARAEDILQQTFLQIHRARGSFVPGAEVLPWAFAIARRLMIDSFRRGRREVLGGEGDAQDERPALDPAADDLVQAQELATRIRRELARLPETQRTAFELVKQEGLSLAEAAQVLGTTVSAVKLRAHRAYEALRAVLGDVLASGDDGEEGADMSPQLPRPNLRARVLAEARTEPAPTRAETRRSARRSRRSSRRCRRWSLAYLLGLPPARVAGAARGRDRRDRGSRRSPRRGARSRGAARCSAARAARSSASPSSRRSRSSSWAIVGDGARRGARARGGHVRGSTSRVLRAHARLRARSVPRVRVRPARADPVQPRALGAALGAAAGAWGGAMIDVHCAVTTVEHLALGHALPIVLVSALVGALVGARVFGLRAR